MEVEHATLDERAARAAEVVLAAADDARAAVLEWARGVLPSAHHHAIVRTLAEEHGLRLHDLPLLCSRAARDAVAATAAAATTAGYVRAPKALGAPACSRASHACGQASR